MKNTFTPKMTSKVVEEPSIKSYEHSSFLEIRIFLKIATYELVRHRPDQSEPYWFICEKIIKSHYRSEGRRQVSGGVFWDCMALSAHYRDSCHHGCLYIHINKRIFISL